MYIELKSSYARCVAGSCFGSRYPSHEGLGGDLELDVTWDFVPRAHMHALENIAEFAGMLVFDKWTGNTDSRQAIFNRAENHQHYRATMIDQGNCFNGAKWTFPDVPMRGFLYNSDIYTGYRSFDAFEPWLGRLENEMNEDILRQAGNEVPGEWYGQNIVALSRLLERLDHRRKGVRDVLWTLLKGHPRLFSNWSEYRVDAKLRTAHSSQDAVGAFNIER